MARKVMTTKQPNDDVCGHIGRINFAGDVAEMRVYPYVFPVDPTEKRVLAIRFDGPQFSAEDLRRLEDWELDTAVFPDYVEFNDYCEGRHVILRARAVIAEWVMHDIADYRARVMQLDTVCASYGKEAAQARKRLGGARTLTFELLRRAEIKSAASDEQKHRQAAAIEALHRLRTHFDGED